MEERYIKAINPYKWVRPATWPTLPTISASDNKMVGIYAVYNNDHNRLGIQTTYSGSINYTIDWGDGSSPVTVINSATTQVKDYSYSSLSGPISYDENGVPYKTVLIQITLNSGTSTGFNLARTSAQVGLGATNQWVELSISWPGAILFGILPVLCQSFKLYKSGIVNGTSVLASLVSCRNFEHYITTNSYSSIQALFFNLGPCNTIGDFTIIRSGSPISALSLFQNSSFRYAGNVVLTNISTCGSLFNSNRNLIKVNSLTIQSTSVIQSIFSSCFNLEEVGSIDIGTGSPSISAVDAFLACLNLRKLTFVDCGKIQTTTAMFNQCFNLTELRMPNMQVTFSVANCNMQRSNLVQLFTDLADLTSLPIQTITITGNPGVSDLTTGDLAILSSKNWGYIN